MAKYNQGHGKCINLFAPHILKLCTSRSLIRGAKIHHHIILKLPVNQNYAPTHIVLAHLICSKHTLKMCFFCASAHFWPLSTFKMCLGVFREKIRGTLKMCSNMLNMCLDTFLASFHILNVSK